MNKFKKATKKIAAVAASAAIVSSTAFAGSLGDYPNNFVSGGVFDGNIVIGADADSAAATSIINDLKSEFSGDNEKTKISYSKVGSGGEKVSAIKSTSQLNYGETLSSVTESGGFDDGDADVLAEGKFNNDISDEDYSQTLTLLNGSFNYALRDEVDGVDKIADGIFYDSGEAFASYVLDLDSSIALTGSTFQADLVGSEIEIMGNDFTVAAITKTSANLTEKLTLVGGSNKIAVGEGETQTVTVDGKDYEVEVLNVNAGEVLLNINGQSIKIDEYDTEDVGGVSVAVTELVDSSRDAVKGYAELVVGGQKVVLKTGDIKINDEDVDDLYPDYEVDVTFGGAGLQTITITYSIDEDTLLEEGDSLKDILFSSFEMVYEGTNEPDYSTLSLSSGKEKIEFSGKLENNKNIPSELQLYYNREGASGGQLYIGDSDYRLFTADSSLNDSAVDLSSDGVNYDNSTGGTAGTLTLKFNVSDTDIKDYGFLIYEDTEEQYIYEIASVDASDKQVDFNELIAGKSSSDTSVDVDDWDTELEKAFTTTNTSDTVSFALSELSDGVVALENELLLDFANTEDLNLTTTGDAILLFRLDSADVDGDETAEEDDAINITLSFPADVDDPIKLVATSADIENSGSLADNTDSSNDDRTYVTKYGIMVKADEDKYDAVEIMVPNEQVYGKVSVIFGGSGTESGSVTVDAADVAAKKAELEEDGFSILSEDAVTSEAVEFDITAPALDSEVTGSSDMIVVGGPAVNAVARDLLGIATYTMDQAGVNAGEGVVRYFEDENSVLVYGYSAADTVAAANKLNEGGLSGTSVSVN